MKVKNIDSTYFDVYLFITGKLNPDRSTVYIHHSKNKRNEIVINYLSTPCTNIKTLKLSPDEKGEIAGSFRRSHIKEQYLIQPVYTSSLICSRTSLVFNLDLLTAKGDIYYLP
jgi:hypothetical protein